MKVLLKKILYVIGIITLCMLITPSPTSAEDEMFEAEYGEYKNDDVHYQIDIISDEELGSDEGILDSIKGMFDIGEGVMSAIYFVFFKILELAFTFNMFMTNLMISILDFSYNINIINDLIDEMSNTVVNMTGLSGGRFSANGLFGAFSGLIALSVALYTLYQFVVNKASIKAFNGLAKSVIAFTLALGFFGNYSTFLKGAHTISNEFSALIISGSSGEMIMDAEGNIKASSVQEKMYDNLFNTFVHKPYLLLQYGQTVGIDEARIKKLLVLDPQTQSEIRTEALLEEVNDLQNHNFTYDSIWKRYNYAGVMVLGNAISSIPVYLLSLSLLLFQFWFLIMAMVAPFALLWAALPGQFGVLKRYLFELALPLVLKSVVSIGALLIFGLTEVIYNLSALAGGGSKGLVLSIVLQTILMMAMYLLRNRIGGIFTKGSTQLGLMRDQINESFIDPTKKAIQTTAALTAGAATAVATGGLAPALAAANIGREVGKAVTGDASVSDAGAKIATTAMGYKMLSNRLAKKQLDPTSKESVEAFASSNALSASELKELGATFNAKGLSNITVEEIEEAKESYLEEYQDGQVNDQNMNHYMANHIAKKRNAATSDGLLQQHQKIATLASRSEQLDKVRAKQLLTNEIGVQETEELYQELNKRRFHNVSSHDVEGYLHEHRLESETAMANGEIPRPFKSFVIEKVQYKQVQDKFEMALNDSTSYLQREHIEPATIQQVQSIIRDSSSYDQANGVMEVKITQQHLQEIRHKYDDYLNRYNQTRQAHSGAAPISVNQYLVKEVQKL